MELAARIGAWHTSGAPLPYDAEVEWIEGDGLACINTLYKPTSKTEFVANALLLKKNNYNPYFFGCDDFNGSRRSAFALCNGTTHGYANCFLFGSQAYYKSGAIWPSGIVEYKFKGKKLYINGVIVNTFNDGDFHSDLDMYIFGANYPTYTGSPINEPGVRFANVIISEIENVILDLIAVRFTNSLGRTEGAMYDRVSGQLFRNAGTGAFVIGPDKVGTELAGGGYKCVRRYWRSSSRRSRSRRFSRWEVAA